MNKVVSWRKIAWMQKWMDALYWLNALPEIFQAKQMNDDHNNENYIGFAENSEVVDNLVAYF